MSVGPELIRAGTAMPPRRPCSSRGRSPCGSQAVLQHPPCDIHVVTVENRNLYEEELEASFRLRHQIYVSERRWEIFRRPDAREIDQYDNAKAINLLAIEQRTRRVVGGARLVPTVHEPPLGEFKLAGRYELPRSPYVFHVSRIIAAADRRENSSLNIVIAKSLCAIQEYCLEEDIEQLTLLVRMSLLPVLMELGWNPQPIDLPDMICGASCLPGTVDISEVALRRTREARGITRSVLVRRGITLPAISGVRVPERLC